MVKDEEVAPYLSEAFSRYASGQKMRDIAKWLNEQNVEPPMKHKKRIQGKPYEGEPDLWTSDNLRGLFRNPTYTGATANGSHQIIADSNTCNHGYTLLETLRKKKLIFRTKNYDFVSIDESVKQVSHALKTALKNTKNRIHWQSVSFVPVDVHFIGIRIRKREKNYSIAATAVLIRRMERN